MTGTITVPETPGEETHSSTRWRRRVAALHRLRWCNRHLHLRSKTHLTPLLANGSRQHATARQSTPSSLRSRTLGPVVAPRGLVAHSAKRFGADATAISTLGRLSASAQPWTPVCAEQQGRFCRASPWRLLSGSNNPTSGECCVASLGRRRFKPHTSTIVWLVAPSGSRKIAAGTS